MSFNFDLNDSFASFAPPTPPDGCTQCGICLPSCPTFAKSEDPEQSPMGRIRLIRTLVNEDSEGLAQEQIEKLESCLGCYSCESVCPSKVSFGKMLDESLALIREQKCLSRISSMMLWLSSRTSLIKPMIQVTYVGQALGLRVLMEKLGLLRLMGLQRANALLGRVKLPERLSNRIHQPPTRQRIALFTGCFSSVMEQTIHQTTINVFNALDFEVVIPKEQGCCGALHRHNGELKQAEKLARNNINAFARKKANAIITSSSGCGASLKQYETWLDDEQISIPIMDVSHYLVSALRQQKRKLDRLPIKVALHTPCTLRQVEGQEEAVIELLQMIPGLELIQLPEKPRCCGAGGSQILSQPEMADALRDDIISAIKAIEPDVLLSSNLGCAMHLRNGLAQAGVNITLQHPIQLVAQAMKTSLKIA